MPPLIWTPRLLTALLLAGGLVLARSAHAGMPYHDGDKLTVTGIVTDAAGHPVEGATVVLEASRASFDVRSFSRAKHDTDRTSAMTDARGQYSLAWTWAGYYNHFDLLIGMPYRRLQEGVAKAAFLQIDAQDLTPRFKGGSPIVAAVTVHDTAPLEALRGFLSGLARPDQTAVYEAMGRPDQVDRLILAGGNEETWWYFEAGKSYRFRDGKQLDVTAFDPVRRF
ncbi:MAG: carboxypeptidase-like regulatory domain-containing protein [Acidobacteriota bacterium]